MRALAAAAVLLAASSIAHAEPANEVAISEGGGRVDDHGFALVELGARVKVLACDEVFARIVALGTDSHFDGDGGRLPGIDLGKPRLGWRHFFPLTDELALSAEVSGALGADVPAWGGSTAELALDYGALWDVTPAVALHVRTTEWTGAVTVGARFVADHAFTGGAAPELAQVFARATGRYAISPVFAYLVEAAVVIQPPSYPEHSAVALGAGVAVGDHMAVRAQTSPDLGLFDVMLDERFAF